MWYLLAKRGFPKVAQGSTYSSILLTLEVCRLAFCTFGYESELCHLAKLKSFGNSFFSCKMGIISLGSCSLEG